jgi:tripartite-type tricarboxylate transporter receptor subunit TctC
MKRSKFLGLLPATLAFSLTPFAFAQTAKYPSRPVKLIVAWPAGGGVDAGARVVAQTLTSRLGQQFIVDNRPGATGAIGTELGAKSAPDGYTVMLGTVDTFEINPHVLPIKYDPLKSFAPVAPLGRPAMALVARSGLPASNIKDVVALAKSQPRQVTYGSWGIGSLGHLGLALFEQIAGIEMLHVPFNGGAPSVQGLLGNQIDLLVMPLFQASEHAKAGKLKILGITWSKRSNIFPSVPTIAEQGYPAYEWEQWMGFFLPADTPAAVRDTLEREINAYLTTPEGMAALREQGVEGLGGTGDELRAMVVKGYNRWGRVVKERNIKVL